jgi:hypothetical protein
MPFEVNPFLAYCQVLSSLATLPSKQAEPIAAASRTSLQITLAQHCEATARVFGGCGGGGYGTASPAKGPSRAKVAKVAKKPKAPSGRMHLAPGPPLGQRWAAAANDPLLWQRVSVSWPDYGGWYEGVVTAVDPATGEHCTLYGFKTDKEELCWFNLRNMPDSFRVLGPASPALVAQIKALQGDEAAADPAAVAAPTGQLGELSREELEAKLAKTNSEAVTDDIGRVKAARKADILARLAALGDDSSSDEE